MKGQNKNIKTLYCLAIMLTIWCTWNSVKSGNLVTELSNLNTNVQLFAREVSNLIDRTDALEKIEPEVITKEVIKEIEVIKEVEVPVLALQKDDTLNVVE